MQFGGRFMYSVQEALSSSVMCPWLVLQLYIRLESPLPSIFSSRKEIPFNSTFESRLQTQREPEEGYAVESGLEARSRVALDLHHVARETLR